MNENENKYYVPSNIIRSVMNNNIRALEYYINRGEDVNQQNKNMLCGVLVAVSGGFIDCLNLLLEHNADLTLVDINGESALDYSCRYRNPYSLVIKDKIECINTLLASGKFNNNDILNTQIQLKKNIEDTNSEDDKKILNIFLDILNENYDFNIKLDRIVKKIKLANRNAAWKKTMEQWREKYYMPGGNFEKLGNRRYPCLGSLSEAAFGKAKLGSPKHSCLWQSKAGFP